MDPASAPGVAVVPIDTTTLGDRSYLAHDGSAAVVVDPQRDIDRVVALAGRLGVTISHVVETHLHNDYVSGGLALARLTGARYHVNANDDVAFDRAGVRDGDLIDVSSAMRMRAIATPGHTYTHLSYAVESAGEPVAVFTGGSLLYGSTGRTDLLGAGHAADLARAQHASARRLAAELPASAAIYPTHGFGSFCSATQVGGGLASTIGQEALINPVLTTPEDDYVRELLAGLDAYPAYYAHMGPANAAGPAAPDLCPPALASAAEVSRRIAAGEWVIDLRDRRAFAGSHARGTLSFPLDGSFATYLGWLIPWGTPVTLLGDTADQVAQAQRELVRIGIDRPAAFATGSPASWSGGAPQGSYPVAEFTDLGRVLPSRPVVILDVRLPLQYAAAHIQGAVPIPLHELRGRLGQVPPGEVWVHCAGGYRASVAASMLAAAGRSVVLVDDDFGRAGEAGLPLEGTQVPQPAAAGR